MAQTPELVTVSSSVFGVSPIVVTLVPAGWYTTSVTALMPDASTVRLRLRGSRFARSPLAVMPMRFRPVG